jgi:hypothetical protein
LIRRAPIDLPRLIYPGRRALARNSTDSTQKKRNPTETGFVKLPPPPPSLTELGIFAPGSDGPFVPGLARPVSGPIGLCGRMLCLAAISVALSPHPKIPFLADQARRRTCRFYRTGADLGGSTAAVFWSLRYGCGFNPSASNCRLHSEGASRKRAMLMPRGKRPSTAARTSLGARKASEIVMLT